MCKYGMSGIPIEGKNASSISLDPIALTFMKSDSLTIDEYETGILYNYVLYVMNIFKRGYRDQVCGSNP